MTYAKREKVVDPGSYECHRLAKELGFIRPLANSRFADRTVYDNLMAVYFKGKTSTGSLTPEEREQWATMLRCWVNARERKVSAA